MKNNSLIYISLVNGAELIAGFESEDTTTLTIQHPLKVHRGLTDGGEYSYVTTLVPYQSVESVPLLKSNVLFQLKIETQELTDLYTSYLMDQILREKGFEDDDLTPATSGTMN